MSGIFSAEGQSLREAFDLFDLEDANAIRRDDLPYLLKTIGMGPEVFSFNDVEDMQRSMDPGETGSITFDSFLRVVKHALICSGSDEEKWKAFKLFDREHRGAISLEDLIATSEDCGSVLSEEQCAFIFDTVRSSNKRGITFEEFKRATEGATLKLKTIDK